MRLQKICNRDQLKMNAAEIIKLHLIDVKKRFGVSRIGIFGSYSRAEETDTSDVDVLVGFEQPVDIFTFLELKEYLETLLKRRVDLVTEKALKPMIKDHVLSEVSYL
jgi:predicted nucleotidyltransferase